jgi:hypothetical protein
LERSINEKASYKTYWSKCRYPADRQPRPANQLPAFVHFRPLQSALQALHDIVARQIPLNINSVVLAETSDEEIVGLAGLAQKLPITLRFICVLGITFVLFSLQGAGI